MLRKFFGWLAAIYSFSALIGALMFLLLLCFSDSEFFGDTNVFVHEDGFGEDSKLIFVFGLAVNTLLCLGTGFLAFKLLRTKGSPPETRTHEQIILDLAVSSHGTLSIAEIAARSPLSVAEAKQGIESLTVQAVAFVEFNEQEDVFYRFPGLGQQQLNSEDR